MDLGLVLTFTFFQLFLEEKREMGMLVWFGALEPYLTYKNIDKIEMRHIAAGLVKLFLFYCLLTVIVEVALANYHSS